MVKHEIVWTDFAVRNLKAIFDYYSLRANSKVAHKIRERILTATRRLAGNPALGQMEFLIENEEYRYLIAGNYKIIYRLHGDQVIVVDIFDARQDPSKILKEDRL